jgi:hypothetical protein
MAIDPKHTHTLYGVLSAKTKNLFDTFALINTWFLFSSFFFSRLEHLITSFGHHHHHDHHLAPSLGVYHPISITTLNDKG